MKVKGELLRRWKRNEKRGGTRIRKSKKGCEHDQNAL
jgi:hypothetical protein